MKKLMFFIAAGLLSGMFFSACKHKTSEYPGFTKTNNGLYYKFFTKSKDTTSVKMGDYMVVSMKYGTIKPDSTMFNSAKLPKAMKIPMRSSAFKGDIYEGLAMMHPGDSARFLCNADSVFGKLFHMPRPKGLDSAKVVFFNIKLLELKTAAQIKNEQNAKLEKLKNEEATKREAYLKDHKVKVKPTKDGIYFISTKKGHGPHPKSGDKVKVQYTGTLLNGKKFDSSRDRKKPFEFVLGEGKVIKGWDEGIIMMRKGGRATLIIPSEMAYGQRQMGPIAPYSTLVFDVELLDFTKGSPKKK